MSGIQKEQDQRIKNFNSLVGRINYRSQKQGDLIDCCIQLLVEYRDLIDVVPCPDQDIVNDFEVCLRGKRGISGKIFYVRGSFLTQISGWKPKVVSFGNYCGNGFFEEHILSIKEQMGIQTGLSLINKNVSMVEMFNRADALLCLCRDASMGPITETFEQIKKRYKETSFDNLVSEIHYPENTPESLFNFCTKLINKYGNQLEFKFVENPNKKVKQAVKVSKIGDTDNMIFVACEKVGGDYGVICSGNMMKFADQKDAPKAFGNFKTLFNVCKGKSVNLQATLGHVLEHGERG